MVETNNEETPINPKSRRKPGYLIVAPWRVISQGGVNGVISHLIREMRATGDYRPVLLEMDWYQREPHWDLSAGFPSCALRFRQPLDDRRGLSNIRVFSAFWITLPAAAARLRKILKNYGIEYINIHYPGPSAAIFFLLKRLRIFRGRVILSLHNSDVRDGFNLRGAPRRLWTNMLREADFIVVVSQELKNEVLRKQPGLETDIRVAYNGVDIACFQDANKNACAPTVGDRDPVILSVASFHKRKGLDVLLRSFQQIRSKHAGARLIIAGQWGQDYPSFKALGGKLGIADAVEWKPDVPFADIPGLLRNADIFVLPSRNEGFPLALLEAGAAGLPVVATRVGGIPEIIIDGETGRLVPPDDHQALAAALSCLLAHPEQRTALAQNLYRIIQRDYSWASMYRQYAKLLT